MPHGSRPDFIRHTVVESCGSSTFDVAFFIIENNWILLPPSLTLLHTYIFAYVNSGHAQLIDLFRGSAGARSPLLLRGVVIKQSGVQVVFEFEAAEAA